MPESVPYARRLDWMGRDVADDAVPEEFDLEETALGDPGAGWAQENPAVPVIGRARPRTRVENRMSRKRLTAATLDQERTLRVAGLRVDLAGRILGAGASDREIVAAGRVLGHVPDQAVESLHRLAGRIAAETGRVAFSEEVAVDDEDDQKDFTTDVAAKHIFTPTDHGVQESLKGQGDVFSPRVTAAKAGEPAPSKRKADGAMPPPPAAPAAPPVMADDEDPHGGHMDPVTDAVHDDGDMGGPDDAGVPSDGAQVDGMDGDLPGEHGGHGDDPMGDDMAEDMGDDDGMGHDAFADDEFAGEHGDEDGFADDEFEDDDFGGGRGHHHLGHDGFDDEGGDELGLDDAMDEDPEADAGDDDVRFEDVEGGDDEGGFGDDDGMGGDDASFESAEQDMDAMDQDGHGAGGHPPEALGDDGAGEGEETPPPPPARKAPPKLPPRAAKAVRSASAARVRKEVMAELGLDAPAPRGARKASKAAKPPAPAFRPSRRRVASAPRGNEFDNVFDVPGGGDYEAQMAQFES